MWIPFKRSRFQKDRWVFVYGVYLVQVPLVPFLHTGRVCKKASVFSERTLFTLLLSYDAQDRRRDFGALLQIPGK